MSAYELQKVIKLWEMEKITTEQAIGQLLLLLQMLSGRIGAIERQLAQGKTLPNRRSSRK